MITKDNTKTSILSCLFICLLIKAGSINYKSQQFKHNLLKMWPLKLHKHNASAPSRAAMMVVYELGLNVDYHEPNTQAGELYQPEFMEKNPMHTIPLLEDGDFAVADSHAIAIYLITKFGMEKRKTLYPEDINKAATIDSRLHFDSGVLFPRLRAITDPTLMGMLTGPNDDIVAKVEEAYQMLEGFLNKSQYLAGDEFTVADICAGATVTSLNTLIPVEGDRFPKIMDWIGALYEHECFMEVNAQGVQDFSAFINQCWEANRARAPPMYYMAR